MGRLVWVLAIACGQVLAAVDTTHGAWDKWLKVHVTASGPVSTVDYRAAKAKPEALNAYVKWAEAVPKTEFDALKEGDRLAFLINAYNALTVKLVVENYPVKSIKDIGGLFSSPWKKKFFTLFGEEHSLDDIEHEMIRKWFAEPRIHFAVVCASKGCPALRDEAFVGAKVDAQLEAAARGFLKDVSRNRYDAKDGKIYLSKIFDWYGGDFVKKYGSVQSFVVPRMATPAEPEAKLKTAELGFGDYDWTLNETPPRATSGS